MSMELSKSCRGCKVNVVLTPESYLRHDDDGTLPMCRDCRRLSGFVQLDDCVKEATEFLTSIEEREDEAANKRTSKISS